MDVITSSQNAKFKFWKKLLTTKGRKQEQAYLVEGWHLVEEALLYGEVIECVVSKSQASNYRERISLPLYVIADPLIQQLSETMTSQEIFCVVRMPKHATFSPKGSYLLLDAVQDPGNLGTLIRTADATGLAGVILGNGCVDLYNSKVLRSAQGSQYHLPIYRMDLLEAINHFKLEKVPVYVTALDKRAVELFHFNRLEQFALVVGNEGNGVSKDVLKSADQIVYIPMYGKAESLNVAVAGSVALYHLARK